MIDFNRYKNDTFDHLAELYNMDRSAVIKQYAIYAIENNPKSIK